MYGPVTTFLASRHTRDRILRPRQPHHDHEPMPWTFTSVHTIPTNAKLN